MKKDNGFDLSKLPIPDTLRGNTDWADWVARIPDLVQACILKWDLALDAPLTDHGDMSYSYIAPASLPDGTKVILKVGSPDHREENEQCEVEALRLCQGDGVVELLDFDEETGTLLLERALPGATLAQRTDDDENTRVAARLMQRFCRPVPEDHTFQPTQYEIDGFDRLRERCCGTTGPLPEKWVRRAEGLYADLMASSTETVLLHADLHHYNILSATREPWLVIDPKGYAGDPGYEVGAYLANYPEESCEEGRLDEIDRRRVHIMSEELDMPLERVAAWGVVLAVIWARWDVSESSGELSDPSDGWGNDIRRARVLHEMV